MKNPKRARSISWRDLGDHVIILDSQGQKKVHHLEDVGALIWKNLDGNSSEEDIVRQICDSFEIGPEQAKKDLQDFIQSLDENGLLNPK